MDRADPFQARLAPVLPGLQVAVPAHQHQHAVLETMGALMETAAILDALGFGAADLERRRLQTEEAQRAVWGTTGLDIIGAEPARLVEQRAEAREAHALRPCEWCGKPTGKPTARARFCSPPCRVAAHKADTLL